MKGTLFSADFVKDSSDNLRLLEFNTDTSIIGDELYNFDLTEFINVLDTNNITQLDIIYKPFIHSKIVEHIVNSVSGNTQSVITINLHDEDINTIYPTTILDSSDKFILRLAYDESALFDSTYCKGTVELLNLFASNNEESRVVSYLYSSSTESYNTLESVINPSNIPDVAVKDIIENFNPIDFYKIGSAVEGETNIDRWDGFIGSIPTENKIIQQYHYGPSSLDENGHIVSIRSFHIVYGSNLDILTLHNYKISSIFELPNSISSEINPLEYANKISDYHYYEYTTNFIKFDCGGLLSTHQILMDDETYKPISEVNVGENIKSYFISGAPQVETNSEILDWYFDGQFFPEGSYITQSEVVYKDEKQLKYGGVIEIVANNESTFVGVNKHFLIYDSITNSSKYKLPIYIKPNTDYLFDIDGELITVNEVNFYVTTEINLKMIELDVEETDTYIISGSSPFNGVISHNAPCFVAGTKITLSDNSYKNVENVEIGDIVLSYNFNTSVVEKQKVRGVGSRKVDKVVKYTFDDNSTLTATLDHPIYSNQIGWTSMDPSYTMNVYGLTTRQSEKGVKIMKVDGTEVVIESIDIISEPTFVYNVKLVENNHNFFANDLLVHNRCFIGGTKITLPDGEYKSIEDVKIGDKVLTYNENLKTTEIGIVGDLKCHNVSSVIDLTFTNDNVITTTFEHPFFVKSKGWVEAKNLIIGDVCITDNNGESTIVDVKHYEKECEVYNLLSVSNNHNFFANKILVHNK
jgi:intein/homing endonuclease